MKPRYRFDIKQMSADCEANYLRLSRLMPSVLLLASEAREEADGASGQYDCELLEREFWLEITGYERPAHLELKIIEQCRYTTTLALFLTLDCGPEHASIGNSLATTLRVRMYHDVRMAEVIAVDGQQALLATYPPGNTSQFQTDEKAQQNHFLGELLRVSLHSGLAVALLNSNLLEGTIVHSAEGTDTDVRVSKIGSLVKVKQPGKK